MTHASGFRAAAFAAVLVFANASCANAQQVPDTTFDTRIARPAWPAGAGPRLVLDESHHEFHTLDGRYFAFGALARSDGFRVSPGRVPLTREALAAADVFVIANACGEDELGGPNATHDAFTADEAAALRAWVEAGGGLLLIADHAPFGAATATLARALGVELRNGYTFDPLRAGDDGPTQLFFSAGAGLDTTHAIVRGRDGGERVRRVKTFTGESVSGPEDAAFLCALSDSAYDVNMAITEAGQLRDAEMRARSRSAAGRAQIIAFALGKGRVVVSGEAAMFSAQLAGPRRQPMGMNQPGNDDRQLVINVLRWLGRKL
ncbi:MAG: DUF4350 domain-containing protein [Candidatus Eisenbacteria bacterium]